MIYLDNASTTRIDSRVYDAMMPYMVGDTFGYCNPGSLHYLGRQAKHAVEKSREYISRFFNCSPENVIFTSGGSEGNNLIISSACKLMRDNSSGIVISNTEHESIIRCAENISGNLTYVKCDSRGIITEDAFEIALRQTDPVLASVMCMNNEVGSINDIHKLSSVAHEHGVLFHTDCVQSAALFQPDVKWLGCDFATISSHKLNGPKGVGAIFVSDKSMLTPLIYGGSEQEFGYRGGTENVPAIVGFGVACDIARLEQDDRRKKLVELRDIFLNSILVYSQENGVKIEFNGGESCLYDISDSKIINMTVFGVDAQTLLLMLSDRGVCVSAGSACCSHDIAPSHVLTSMGISAEHATQSIRISISHENTKKDMEIAAYIIIDTAKRLLNIGGYNE